MFALQQLMGKLGVNNIDCRQDGTVLHPRFGRASYIFNPTVAGIEQADSLWIIGANPRRESPVLNARIRKRWRMGNFPINVVGEHADLTYTYTYHGAGAETLADFAGRAEVTGERPLVLVGQGALARSDGAAILALAVKLAQGLGAVKEGWNGFGVLHTAAARVGGLDLGFVPAEGALTAGQMAREGALDVLFLLGADEIDVGPGAFVIYQGSHGDRGAHRADVILPGSAYTEKSGLYVNTEGRVQRGERAAFPPGDAREDWAILRALSDVLGVKLPFDSLPALRKQLAAAHPHFGDLDQISTGDSSVIGSLADLGGGTDKAPFTSPVTDFYLTNPIARASAVMAECSALNANRLHQQAAE